MPERAGRTRNGRSQANTVGELAEAYAFLLEPIKAGVVLIDSTLETKFINAAASRLTGVHVADALNKPLSDWCGSEFASRLRARKFSAVRGLSLTLREKTFRVIVSPLLNDAGIIGAVLVFYNGGESFRANPDAFKSQHNLVRTLDRMEDRTFFVTDAKLGQQVFINDGVRKLTGWSPATLMEGTFGFIMSLMHPDDVVRCAAGVKDVVTRYSDTKRGFDNEPFSLRYRFRRKDGSYISLVENGCLLSRDTDGSPHYILSFLEVITPKALSKASSSIRLTNREYEVAMAVIQGDSSKIIASNLGLSVHTVNEVRQNLRRKTGAANTAALVKYLSAHNIR